MGGKLLAVVNTDKFADKIGFSERLNVGGDNLWIISNDGTVIMIVAKAFVNVIAHAGIKNGVNLLFN